MDLKELPSRTCSKHPQARKCSQLNVVYADFTEPLLRFEALLDERQRQP